jgi:hypothetical protein
MKDTPVTYMLFDLLWLDGHSLMELPYEERHRRLGELGLGEGSLQTPDYLVGQGGALLEAATQQGLEGVVAKHLDSSYQPGRRSGSWIKVKRPGRQEFVVGGWLAGKGSRSRRIGALLLGVGEPDGSLRYVGRVAVAGAIRPLRACSAPAAVPPTAAPRGDSAAAAGRGVLQRVDRRRAPAPPRVSGTARGQAGVSSWGPLAGAAAEPAAGAGRGAPKGIAAWCSRGRPPGTRW